MRFRFTNHAKKKFILIRRVGFKVSLKQVKQCVISPLKIEEYPDGTYIATTLLDKSHVLRVVYRKENDIMVIITFHPGRRKRYEV